MTDTAPKALHDSRGGFPEIKPVDYAPPELGRLVAAMRRLQDLTVSTNPDCSMWTTAAEHVESVCALLEDHQMPEGLAAAGRVIDLPGLGHPLLPPWILTQSGPGGVTMEGRFNRSHVGGRNAVHGVLSYPTSRDNHPRCAVPIERQDVPHHNTIHGARRREGHHSGDPRPRPGDPG